MNQSPIFWICGISSFLGVLFVLIISGIRIVPEDKRIEVFRLGRSIGRKGPGFIWLIPIIDIGRKVDLTEMEENEEPV
jgi:regulator of protease activity HflC (stomatin/prohibitin superfamily)